MAKLALPAIEHARFGEPLAAQLGWGAAMSQRGASPCTVCPPPAQPCPGRTRPRRLGFGLLMGGYRTDHAVSAFRLQRRMRQQADTDELTSLLNRAGWNREATKAYEVALTRGVPLSLSSSTSISSKSVNDAHGHEAGDLVLQMLGRNLLERADNGSYLARFGGEELVSVFVDHSPEQSRVSSSVSVGNSHLPPSNTARG